MRAKASESSNSLSAANIGFHLFRQTLLRLLPRPRVGALPPPVVIGALGGSGTRVIPAIMRDAGYWMGAWVNPKTEDAMATRYFLQRYFDCAVRDTPDCNNDLYRACSAAVAAHRWGMPDATAPWGWKNPRCMWVIPFLSRIYPGMKFIHVVRDGRDMALTNNKNLLRKHGDFLLEDEATKQDEVNAQLELWTKGNRTARLDGERCLGENYMSMTYEELVLRPRETIQRLFEHLEMDVSDAFLDKAQGQVRPSRSIGMWRRSDLPQLHAPDAATREALELFGYDVEGQAVISAELNQSRGGLAQRLAESNL
jgi:hypothetical protein